MQKLSTKIINNTLSNLTLEQKAVLSIILEEENKPDDMKEIDGSVDPNDFVAYLNIVMRLKVQLMEWIANYFKIIVCMGQDKESMTRLYNHVDSLRILEEQGISRELIIKIAGVTLLKERPTKKISCLCKVLSLSYAELLKGNQEIKTNDIEVWGGFILSLYNKLISRIFT